MAGYFELKTAKDGQTYWNLKAGNHEVILTSQMYSTRPGAENGISAVQSNCDNEENYREKEQSNGSPYFFLVAKNRREIGRSEAYRSYNAMKNGICSVRVNGQSTDIKDKTEGAL